jgi:hypothetical protein
VSTIIEMLLALVFFIYLIWTIIIIGYRMRIIRAHYLTPGSQLLPFALAFFSALIWPLIMLGQALYDVIINMIFGDFFNDLNRK